MLSKAKKGTLLTLLLLVLLMTPISVQAKKKTNTNKKTVTKTVSSKSTKKKKQKSSTKKKKTTAKKKKKELEWNRYNKTLYAKDNIIIYSSTDTGSEKISTFIPDQKIKVQKISSDKKWLQVIYKMRKRYISANDTSLKQSKSKKAYKGKRLTERAGVCYGPSGRETYYNMRMDNVVSIMRNKGYSSSKYSYWIRDDGAKMLGKYVIIAANLKLRPKGTLVKTSLGVGIVCDTGGFARRNPTGIDIAVNW